MPGWDCVISSRGMGLAAEAMRMRGCATTPGISMSWWENASELAEVAEADLSLSARGVTHHFTLILSGYSRSRRTFETHTVRTRPGPAGMRMPAESWNCRPSVSPGNRPCYSCRACGRDRRTLRAGAARGQANFQLTNQRCMSSRCHGVRYCPAAAENRQRTPGARLRWRLRPGHPRNALHLPPAPPDQHPRANRSS